MLYRKLLLTMYNFVEVLGGLINRGAYNWRTKSSSKQVTVVLIKTRFTFTNQISFNTYMRGAFIWGRGGGAYNRMIVFVYR